MQIDWIVFATIVAPILTLFLGIAIKSLLERKPKLIAYFTHATSFPIQQGVINNQINTHGIIIRNAGEKTALDIRVRHRYLPEHFNVYPGVKYKVEELPGGGKEIVFPKLVPNEQISIAYLYHPPVVYSQIHEGIVHEGGFAIEVTALPTQIYPSWIIRSLWALLILGIATCIYIIYAIIKFLPAIYESLQST